MTIATLTVDTTGKIESGYFYAIYTRVSERDLAQAGEDWFVRDVSELGGPLYGSAVTLQQEKLYECPRDQTHCTGGRPKKIELDLSGCLPCPFIPEMSLILVDSTLAGQLQTSGLSGLTFVDTEVLPNGNSTSDSEIYALFGSGHGPFLADRIIPESANRCPKCGFAPLVCPGCGWWRADCPKCKHECFVLLRDHMGESDPRIAIIPTPDEGPIVDASAWNGCDFFGHTGAYATWRAVEFLYRIGARPFVAQPLRARLDGMTKKQREWLTRSRQPLK